VLPHTLAGDSFDLLPTFLMHVGLTGAQQPMTLEQQAHVRSILLEINATDTHHGDCIGADADFHAICLDPALRVHIHPPVKDKKRAFRQGAASMAEPKEYLRRNHDLVEASQVLVAAPSGTAELRRSGEWATIRYARKLGRTLWLVFPDGSVRVENA
jgi:hypothetical protein